jgi:hypothetical protein
VDKIVDNKIRFVRTSCVYVLYYCLVNDSQMQSKVIKMDIKSNKKLSLATQLMEVSAHATSELRMKTAVSVGVSLWTIDRYLKGEVGNIARAERILKEIKRLAA